MRRLLGIVVLVLCVPARPVSAQAITSYTFYVFNQGATLPFTTTPLPVAGFTCGLTPITPPSGTVNNPTHIYVTDPGDSTKQCRYTDPGTGPLLALPFGTQVYVAQIDAVNSAGPSGKSANSGPFAHVGTVPATPTGLIVAP